MPGKNEEIPEVYIRQYDRIPPLYLVTVGFKNHGKTCYLAALTITLQNLSRVWKHGFAYWLLDDYTRVIVEEIRRQAMTGEVPPSNPLNVPRPIFMNTANVPDFGSNCLVLYDTAGELFEKFPSTDQAGYLRCLREVRNIWFLLSLIDLEENPQKTINDLLNVYLIGMARLGWSAKGRNLIVVYTKADTLNSRPDFPDDLRDYLFDDPFQDIANYQTSLQEELENISMSDYFGKMKEISERLEDYTRNRIPGGGAFIELAKLHGMGLHFSITSALGGDPEDGKLQQEATRYRVLDPYFWALNLNQPEVTIPIHLILDGARNSIEIYKYSLDQLAEDLGNFGEVVTNILGQVHPASISNQTPPTRPPGHARPRLIGPILEKARPKALFIVLSIGKIWDLNDYLLPEWWERILLVWVGEDAVQNWPNQLVLRSHDDPRIIIEEFRRQFLNRLET